MAAESSAPAERDPDMLGDVATVALSQGDCGREGGHHRINRVPVGF